MKNFFKKIDILITAGGITSFEALCSNVKCIYVPVSYYQKTSCNFLKKNKIPNILNYSKVFSKNGKELLFNCFKKISKENNLSGKKTYLDNKGSKRIADYILGKEFSKSISLN